MNKKEMNIQKEIIVNKLYFAVVMLLLMACNNSEKENSDEMSVLQTYVLELKNYVKQDTLYVEENNSNEFIFKRYEQFVQLEDSIKNKMPDVLKLFFSKDEEINYGRQRHKRSVWDINENKSFMKIEDVRSKKPLLHISKPVFLSDKRYCMIYSLRKENDNIYYIPPMQFYENKNDKWVKIYTLPSIMFKNSMKDKDILKLYEYVGGKSNFYSF